MARPTLGSEPLAPPKDVQFTKRQINDLKSRSAASGASFNHLVRKAIDHTYSESRSIEQPSILPLLGSAPCGALRECIEQSEMFDLGDIAEFIRTKPGDFLIRADGISMESEIRASIPDGSIIIFRPDLEPQGKVALCRILTVGGEYLWTIKRWHNDENGFRLVDGSGASVLLPDDTAEVNAVAVKIAHIHKG